MLLYQGTDKYCSSIFFLPEQNSQHTHSDTHLQASSPSFHSDIQKLPRNHLVVPAGDVPIPFLFHHNSNAALSESAFWDMYGHPRLDRAEHISRYLGYNCLSTEGPQPRHAGYVQGSSSAMRFAELREAMLQPNFAGRLEVRARSQALTAGR